MKVNVIKAKDKYAQSWGSLDWYEHISGMSVSDVELEMEYVFEQVTTEMLEMLIELKGTLADGRTFGYNEYDRLEQLIKEATEL